MGKRQRWDLNSFLASNLLESFRRPSRGPNQRHTSKLPKKPFKNIHGPTSWSPTNNQLHYYTLTMNNPKRKPRKQFHLTASKRIQITLKIMSINWINEYIQQGQKTSTGNYKILLKEMKEDIDKWKNTPHS